MDGNPWLTLVLTGPGWLASLDLAAPTQRLILSHRTASPHALYDVLGLDGGRGKTMSDLVDSDRELPVNLTKLHKANPDSRTRFGGIVDTSCSYF